METTTNVSTAIELWKSFNLDEKRLILDKQCGEMREAKAISISGRKKLNEVTRLFRSKTKEEQANNVADILKLYQEEIDQLSRRSKYCETSFFSLYKALYDCADPVPVMENLMNNIASLSTHQLEIDRLQNELKQYDDEFQQLKNQDITIRQLEDQILEYQYKIEEKVQAEVLKEVAEIEDACEKKINEVRDNQRAAEKRLAQALEANNIAQLNIEKAQNELFELSTSAEKRASDLQLENSMLSDLLERCRARLGEVEGELMSKSSGGGVGNFTSTSRPSDQGDKNDTDNQESLEEQVEVLNGIVMDLRRELVHKEELMAVERKKQEESLRRSNKEVDNLRVELDSVRNELQKRPTQEAFNDCKRQLRVLRKVLFNTEEEEDDDDDGNDQEGESREEEEEAGIAFKSRSDVSSIVDVMSMMQNNDNERSDSNTEQSQSKGLMVYKPSSPHIGVGSGGGGHKLEAVLLAGLKSLQSEIVEARSTVEGLKQRDAASKTRIEELTIALEGSQALVVRLEADLQLSLSGASRGSLSEGGKSVRGGKIDIEMDVESENVNRANNELRQLLATPDSNNMFNDISSSAGTADTGNVQMVSILQAQRDRYKERVDQVEMNLRTVKHRLLAVETEKARLESENLQMYTKIRYMQSYSSGNASSGHTGHTGHTISSMMRDEEFLAGGGGASSESKYESIYEQQMNPFAMFSQLEKQKRIAELSVPEKILFNTTVSCMSSKAGRSFLVIYLGAMHLLVFSTLYYVAHKSHC